MLPRFSRCFASLRYLFLMIGLASLLVNARAALPEDERFSSTLSTSQRAETGLAQLTEDNIAVIDALVRQDETILKKRGRLGSLGSFSQRRTENERELAGLGRLTPEQLARLDGLAGMRISPPAPMIYAETTGRRASSNGVLVRTEKRPLEIHGSTSLSYSWSKAGSVRGGDMQVSIQDPDHRYSITIGYSEYHGKGLSPVYYDPADDLYRYRSIADSPLDRR